MILSRPGTIKLSWQSKGDATMGRHVVDMQSNCAVCGDLDRAKPVNRVDKAIAVERAHTRRSAGCDSWCDCWLSKGKALGWIPCEVDVVEFSMCASVEAVGNGSVVPTVSAHHAPAIGVYFGIKDRPGDKVAVCVKFFSSRLLHQVARLCGRMCKSRAGA